MQCAHVDRQAGGVEAHGDEDAALDRLARLAAYPARLDRLRGPDDHHGRASLSSAAIWMSNSWPGEISGSHQTDQPCASIAATSGATRALSARA